MDRTTAIEAFDKLVAQGLEVTLTALRPPGAPGPVDAGGDVSRPIATEVPDPDVVLGEPVYEVRAAAPLGQAVGPEALRAVADLGVGLASSDLLLR